MPNVVLPRIGTADAWRDAARGCLGSGIPPEDVIWDDTTVQSGLFDDNRAVRATGSVSVPRSFVDMARTVVWHSDPERFARLYSFLWRVRDAPQLMSDRGDADLAQLRRMERNVRRCQHKMKAFVRFREIGQSKAGRRSFAAWFEPTHHTVEPTAQFFANRFGDMDWRIITPDVSAFCENGVLRFELDHARPDLPEDASEELWVTYFRNIFNPARLKVQAMHSEMPKKYWKNLPEAAAIRDLVASAPARARAMADAVPTLSPTRAAAAQAQQAAFNSVWEGGVETMPRAIHDCTRCPLHKTATQPVLGEGPLDARLMVVGEQPGDREDLEGRPFVGPSGQLFDHIASQVGLRRDAAFVTNAVKHFKFVPKGRRRIHQRPDAGEVEHCSVWLEAEIRQVQPDLILAMGATAALALTGSGLNIALRRGSTEETPFGPPALLTYHPSYLLRIADIQRRKTFEAQFRSDLDKARQIAQADVADKNEITARQ
ncbi:MAG: UdgX family uracil-DNA binding protein [Pseudomonadota bacterium]